MFNFLCVLVLLPLEVMNGYLFSLSEVREVVSRHGKCSLLPLRGPLYLLWLAWAAYYTQQTSPILTLPPLTLTAGPDQGHPRPNPKPHPNRRP